MPPRVGAGTAPASGEDLGLRRGVLGVVEDALLVQLVQPLELVGRARPPLVPAACWTYCLNAASWAWAAAAACSLILWPRTIR